MSFQDAIISGFLKYFDFEGRARRSEYWFFTLFCILGGFVAALVDIAVLRFPINGLSPINALFAIATLVPSLAVGVRRLHDFGKSGWFMLLLFLPVIGWIVLIYWACQPGTSGKNLYGNDPIVEGGYTPAGTSRGEPTIMKAESGLGQGGTRLVFKANGKEHEFPLDRYRAQSHVKIGRDEQCAIFVNDRSVSREHATLWMHPRSGPMLCDMQSSNGTFVDEQRIGKDYVPLEGTRRIRLGDVEMRLAT